MWTFLETVSDHCLVDYWHACQHLAKAKDAIGDKAKTWYARHKTILRNDFDGADKVIRSVRHYRRTAQGSGAAETLREVQTYFENNRHRMSYRLWRTLGRPIGSGVVEAANKTLVTRRLKLSGPALAPRGRPGGVDLAITLSVGPLRCRLETCHCEIEIHCRSAVSKRQR